METSAKGWHLLPADLRELQIGQIDLLLAMYPDEATMEENSQKIMDRLRCHTDDEEAGFDLTPNVSVLLQVTIEEASGHREALQLDITFPFTKTKTDSSHEPPPTNIRIQKPSWLSKADTALLMSSVQEGEELFSTVDQIKETAIQQLEHSKNVSLAKPEMNAGFGSGPLVRVWFYFPSISTRSKRDDFINYAPAYHLTGFLYAGKPGLLCVEGNSQSIDDYMKFIKTQSWGDIPGYHKKVSERHRESIDQRVFPGMTETTDTVGERHGQRANRGHMKAMEGWLIERGLGDAFGKVLM